MTIDHVEEPNRVAGFGFLTRPVKLFRTLTIDTLARVDPPE